MVPHQLLKWFGYSLSFLRILLKLFWESELSTHTAGKVYYVLAILKANKLSPSEDLFFIF